MTDSYEYILVIYKWKKGDYIELDIIYKIKINLNNIHMFICISWVNKSRPEEKKVVTVLKDEINLSFVSDAVSVHVDMLKQSTNDSIKIMSARDDADGQKTSM